MKYVIRHCLMLILVLSLDLAVLGARPAPVSTCKPCSVDLHAMQCMTAGKLCVLQANINQMSGVMPSSLLHLQEKEEHPYSIASAVAVAAADVGQGLTHGRALANHLFTKYDWTDPSDRSQSRFNTQVHQPLLEDAWKHLQVGGCCATAL
jgi:hypothetical protein